MSEKVVTRFAPSPTGSLHVGGARTALFNWAYAKGRGTFILRLEDTDQARSSINAAKSIISSLDWLGINWNAGPDPKSGDPFSDGIGEGGPFCQSQRLDTYKDAIKKLKDAGHAYDDGEAVRFRMPKKDITVPDAILGEVTVKADQIEDFVIQKSDGFPTYHLAVVVDDAEMGITHVIRGQEHLNNAPKHWALQEALGYDHPVFAHIPLIFNADGSKMSKRDKDKAARKAISEWMDAKSMPWAHDPSIQLPFERYTLDELAYRCGIELSRLTSWYRKEFDDPIIVGQVREELGFHVPEIDVYEFQISGYLPEALCNYLALLGWNPGNDIEKFDNAFLCEHFSLERVGKKAGRFDRDKLFRFNADAIKALPLQEFEQRWREYCKQYNPAFAAKLNDAAFTKLAGAYHQRSRTLAEPCELAAFFTCDDDAVHYDPKAMEKVIRKNNEGYAVLADLLPRIDAIADGGGFGTAVHDLIKQYAEEKSIGMGKVAQPLRVAVSGNTVTPEIDATMDILGKDRVIARIKRCMALST